VPLGRALHRRGPLGQAGYPLLVVDYLLSGSEHAQHVGRDHAGQGEAENVSTFPVVARSRSLTRAGPYPGTKSKDLGAAFSPLPKVYLVEPLAPIRQDRQAEAHGQAVEDESRSPGTKYHGLDPGLTAGTRQRQFFRDYDQMPNPRRPAWEINPCL
jgi:hypothetical protein